MTDVAAIDLAGGIDRVAEYAAPAGTRGRDDGLAARLARYGIDPRARSALRALSRFRGLDAASGHWAAVFADRLAVQAGARLKDNRALPRFVDLFFQLLARDFAGEWLDELGGAWRALLDAGCEADLPLRTAHQFTERCVEMLKRDRDSYSRLDAEIAWAVGSAGLFLCAVLADAAGSLSGTGAAPSAGSEPRGGASATLRAALEAALARRNARITGLLTVQLEAGSSAALAIEEEQWPDLHARAESRLRDALRDSDVLCRIGPARFGVVLPRLRSQAQVMLAANKLARLFESPVSAAGRECRLMPRVGAAWAPDHGAGAAQLMRGASLALREAARLGRPVALFEQALLENSERDSQIEEEFLRALDGGGLELHFQPQIDVASGRCVGAEALLRWPGASRGPVPPPVTLAVAERLGVAPQLTRWILHRACRTAAEFARLGLELEVSVNLTAGDIGDPELPLAVRNALELWRVDARLLKFELTESAMLANEAVCVGVMAALRRLGAATSIDDFGTGYSSVILLKKLPLNELKLDRCFVAGAVESRQDREIVRSLILLAHSLNLEVVAEGIEDAPTLALLRDFGCDRAQGYLISKPLPPEQFICWARAHAAGQSEPTVRRVARGNRTPAPLD